MISFEARKDSLLEAVAEPGIDKTSKTSNPELEHPSDHKHQGERLPPVEIPLKKEIATPNLNDAHGQPAAGAWDAPMPFEENKDVAKKSRADHGTGTEPPWRRTAMAESCSTHAAKVEGDSGSTNAVKGEPEQAPVTFNPGFPLTRREMREWAQKLGIPRRELERCMGVERSK